VRRSQMASAGNWRRQISRYVFAPQVDILFFIAIDSRLSDGGKLTEYFTSHVRKTYGLGIAMMTAKSVSNI